MVCLSPTFIPPEPLYPLFLTRLPRDYPVPLPPRNPNTRYPPRFKDNPKWNWGKYLDDLSDEENEFEEKMNQIQHRGTNFLVPIGRLLTQQEEKADVNGDGESGSDESDNDGVGNHDAENNDGNGDASGDDEPEGDLDADMEDYDQEGGEEEDDEDEEIVDDDEVGHEPAIF